LGSYEAAPHLSQARYANPAHHALPSLDNYGQVHFKMQKGPNWQAEHGGFNKDDTNVALLVSNPGIKSESISNAVATTQIAPSILKLLGLDPWALQAVREEHTELLPQLF